MKRNPDAEVLPTGAVFAGCVVNSRSRAQSGPSAVAHAVSCQGELKSDAYLASIADSGLVVLMTKPPLERAVFEQEDKGGLHRPRNRRHHGERSFQFDLEEVGLARPHTIIVMNHSIRIKREGPRRLIFEVLDGAGKNLGVSEPFTTICRLEAGFATLCEAAKSPEGIKVSHSSGRTSVGSGLGRRQLHFVGRLQDDAIHEILVGAQGATIVDERPQEHRRGDLSGPLRDLTH